MSSLRAVVVIDYQNIHLTGHGLFACSRYSPPHEALVDPLHFANQLISARNRAQRPGMAHAVLSHVRVYRGQPSPEHDPKPYARNQAQQARWERDRRVTVHLRPLKYRYERDSSGRPLVDVNGKRVVEGKDEKGVDVLCALAVVREALQIELLDGALLVNPPPGGPHQRLSSRLWHALDVAAPVGFEVLEGIGMRTAPGRILIPDLTIVTNPGSEKAVWDPADVAMVVEISSPSRIVNDRAIKPELYAWAKIPHYLRIELGDAGPAATAYRLADGDYAPAGDRVKPGQLLRLGEPFAAHLDLARLARAVHPGH
ncbi:MAG: hypothetical protein GEU83_12345 [Pseudonocardiaceae bacterium]|nr:hypothetical protein [Pseudonocardiaceae bacterium]